MSIRRGPKPLDLTNKEFGWLTALMPTGRSNRYGLIWKVRCRCGKEFEKGASEISRKAKTPSQAPRTCGCYYKTHHSPRFLGVGDLSRTKWAIIEGSAKRRNLPFEITIKYAWDLFITQDRKCALSGVSIKVSSDLRAGKNTASLDRIDSRLGYIVGNVQWVHVLLNDMKSNLQDDEFIEWCRRVADHSRGMAMGSEFGKPPAELKSRKPYVY
jgi:hypothetical protein